MNSLMPQRTLQRFAVIGNPISHSRSPEIHAAFARALNINMTYERILAPLDDFAATVLAFRDASSVLAKGVNVTLPFKTNALAIASTASPRAIEAGAANTLRFDGDDIYADNTDGVGLVRDLVENLRTTIRDKRILLVGAGGAARGVVGALLDESPAMLVLTNRTRAKAEDIAARFSARHRIVVLSQADLTHSQFDIIINATSASIAGDLPPIPSTVFAAGSMAYDMMYGKGETPFMMFAAHAGAKTADGLGMLVEQAAEAFFIWHDARPQTAALIASMRQTVSAAP